MSSRSWRRPCASFLQLAWLDKRTTSGNSPVASDFPNLPAWICKAVGGTTTHWAGASLRFQPREFRVRTEYGEVPGASLLDWPLTYEEMEPYYAKLALHEPQVAGPATRSR